MTNKTKKQAAPLSKNATKYLRGVAHHISPLVTIADKGVTENILTELDICLERHELVKVKIRADREARKAMDVAVAEKMKEATAGLPIPPGMNLGL